MYMPVLCMYVCTHVYKYKFLKNLIKYTYACMSVCVRVGVSCEWIFLYLPLRCALRIELHLSQIKKLEKKKKT